MIEAIIESLNRVNIDHIKNHIQHARKFEENAFLEDNIKLELINSNFSNLSDFFSHSINFNDDYEDENDPDNFLNSIIFDNTDIPLFE